MPIRSNHPVLTRRNMLKLGAVAAAAGIAPAARGAEQLPALSKPNVLLLMSDQHRGDTMGCAGNAAVHTPNMDRLAREGARFANMYSTTPTCTPARTALLTGLAPWRHGMLGYGRIGEGYAVEMPQAMRDAGYYTLGIGKMHWHPQRQLHGFHRTILDESGREMTPEFRSDYRAWLMTNYPTIDPDVTGLTFNDHRAWPYKLADEAHPTHWTGDTAVNFISTYQQPEPFFLKVSFARPHSPWDPPQRWWDRYAETDLPKARVGKWAEKYAQPGEDFPDYWHGDMGADTVRTARQGYYGSISFVDEQIGRILAALEEAGKLENTLILYISDHGDMTGDHHLWRKSYAYEASAKVPLLVRWPKGALSELRGKILDQPVEIRDILPTCLDAAGNAAAAAGLDGTSILPLIADQNPNWRDAIDLEHDVCYDASNHWTGMTDGKSKYIFHVQTGEEQFFNLREDPNEEHDLASDGSRHLSEWRDRMIEHLAERGEPFVVNGKLGVRPESFLYSKNWPGCACHGTERRINA
ncbi:MAG: arylsulfatase [Candidatus Hydrogenedentes bacterium]|nr:arylsulfatase [Candidatus Hydrogenedentota bacterium]